MKKFSAMLVAAAMGLLMTASPAWAVTTRAQYSSNCGVTVVRSGSTWSSIDMQRYCPGKFVNGGVVAASYVRALIFNSSGDIIFNSGYRYTDSPPLHWGGGSGFAYVNFIVSFENGDVFTSTKV